jgi:hypothetical protein
MEAFTNQRVNPRRPSDHSWSGYMMTKPTCGTVTGQRATFWSVVLLRRRHSSVYYNRKNGIFFRSKELPEIGICLPCNKKALKFESELLLDRVLPSRTNQNQTRKRSKEKVKGKAITRDCFFLFHFYKTYLVLITTRMNLIMQFLSSKCIYIIMQAFTKIQKKFMLCLFLGQIRPTVCCPFNSEINCSLISFLIWYDE